MSSYGTAATIKALSGLSYTDLGLANDTAFDTLISSINTAVSQMINTYCQRDFDLHEDDTFTMFGQNSKILRLPVRPIVTINSITVNDGTALDSDDYIIRRVPNSTIYAGSIQHKTSIFYKSDEIDIDVDWGYSSPPADVAKVAENLAIAELQGLARQKTQQGKASSISMGGYSISYADMSQTQAQELAKLDRYRMVIV